MRQDAAVEV